MTEVTPLMSMVGAACATVVAATSVANGLTDRAKLTRELLINRFALARAMRSVKVTVSDALLAPVKKAPGVDFKSKSSFKISSSKCCLKFEDKGFISGSQEGDAKLLQRKDAPADVNDWCDKNRCFSKCFRQQMFVRWL